VVSIVAHVASTIRPRAQQRGNTLSVEFRGEVPKTILSDAERLRQALINLAGNAVKFTEGGSVRIVVSLVPSWRSGRPALRIDVVDTGVGIREEVLGRLFQPFSQGDASVSRKFGGTGLGLAISRQVADLLGGELTAQSTFGQGSTFTLTVPTGDLQGVEMVSGCAESVEPHQPARRVPFGKDLAGVRVLLAEDGFDNQQLICTVLRNVGADVEAVENGRLALERAEAQSFDVILMDMSMPEMDGYQAAQALRDRGYQGPILALTANAMSGDGERSRQAGCNEHLTKPIDRSALIRTIGRYVVPGTANREQPPVHGAPECR
jgi:CheY-like chemotaxis protein